MDLNIGSFETKDNCYLLGIRGKQADCPNYYVECSTKASVAGISWELDAPLDGLQISSSMAILSVLAELGRGEAYTCSIN